MCKFIKIDDNWGIKVYTYKEYRDYAWTAQQNMHRVECAPAVGIKIDIGNKYCYLTQIAEPIMPALHDKHTEQEYRQWQDEYSEKWHSGVKHNIEEVVDKMRANGYKMYDNHLCNYGWLHGKLVCIDFGDAYEVMTENW